MPQWDDKPVILVGGGASLRGFDLDRLAALDAYVVGINQSMLHMPFCCAGVSADGPWLAANVEAANAFMARPNQPALYVVRPPGTWERKLPGCHWLAVKFAGGLATDLGTAHGCDSGHAAINVAAHRMRRHVPGRRIVLLGYDYGHLGGRHHYHDDYKRTASDETWHTWATRYEQTARDLAVLGIEVINASPDSAIAAFRKVTIEEALGNIKTGPKSAANAPETLTDEPSGEVRWLTGSYHAQTPSDAG